MSDAPTDIADGALEERAWPVVIKLSHPVDFGSEHITELKFRRGIAGDLKGLNVRMDEFPTNDQLMVVASRMCGQHLKVLEMLDADDIGGVLEVALTFFMRSLGIGKKR